MSDALPYRLCAGVALFNRTGEVLIGRRIKPPRDERASEVTHEWQMPQGGIDAGESPLEAARRELYEETNVRSVSLLAEAPDWFNYDLPPSAQRWRGRYRGQTQKWFAFRFKGADSEIDIAHPAGGGHSPEFADWRWEPLERTPALVVPFKRPVYEQVAALFAPYAKPSES